MAPTPKTEAPLWAGNTTSRPTSGRPIRGVRLSVDHHAILFDAQNSGLTEGQHAQLRDVLAPLWDCHDIAAALSSHDLATVYRILNREVGIQQRALAVLTSQSQSEIAEILAGRKVRTYALLLRIATGLGIPRWRMGLSTDAPGPAPARPQPVHKGA